MPSQINPRSGPFPIYGSTSPPTVDVGMFTIAKTGVDLKTAATTSIFTVPTGRAFLCTGWGYLVTAVNTPGSGVIAAQIKESSSSRLMSGAFTSNGSTPVAGQSSKWYSADVSATPERSNCTAGNIVQYVQGTSSAGSTAVTGTVYVTGFYTQ